MVRLHVSSSSYNPSHGQTPCILLLIQPLSWSECMYPPPHTTPLMVRVHVSSSSYNPSHSLTATSLMVGVWGNTLIQESIKFICVCRTILSSSCVCVCVCVCIHMFVCTKKRKKVTLIPALLARLGERMNAVHEPEFLFPV